MQIQKDKMISNRYDTPSSCKSGWTLEGLQELIVSTVFGVRNTSQSKDSSTSVR